MEENVQAN